MPDRIEVIYAELVGDRNFYRRWFRILVLAILALSLFTAAIGVAGYLANSHRIDENDTARAGLCALRQARVVAVQDALKFLDRHPNGIPGITRSDILRNVKLQRETITALAGLRCADVTKGG